MAKKKTESGNQPSEARPTKPQLPEAPELSRPGLAGQGLQPTPPEETTTPGRIRAEFGSITVALEGGRPSAEVMAASSEEFRESLQTLHGALELLISGKVPDLRQSKKFLNIAFRESEYLGNRASDLQVASLLEAGRLRLKLTAVDLGGLLQSVVEKLSAPAIESEVTLELAAAEELAMIRGDEGLLRMVLTNLVERCIRATPATGTVQIQTEPLGERVQLRIVSRGSDDPKFTEIRLNETRERGLALYVAERVAYAHEAEFTLLGADQEVKGFELSLPVQLKGRGRGKILVVDDNLQSTTLLQYALQEEGYEAIKALNGLEGLKLARSELVDLVILDILLPGIDGFEVCHRLRSAPETASTPVIMVSAKSREEDRATALRIGADAYFGKPLGVAELMTAIENLLEDRNSGNWSGG